MATKHAYAMLVAAHPDDPETGAGGTVAKLVKEGKEVVYVICTQGDKGSSDPDMTPAKLAKIREAEQTEAAKVAGVTQVVFLHYHDQELEDTAEFRKQIVRQIRMFRPQIVLIADPYRKYIGHRDHRVSAQVTLDAIFPYARDRLAYPDLIAEGLEPHKVKEVWCWGTDEPNHCVDISETFEIKIAAIRAHKSQFGDFKGLETNFRERCRLTGEKHGFNLGEAFHREEIFR
jgi:LmbE family N-acetylglucosaminyl deacetylase